MVIVEAGRLLKGAEEDIVEVLGFAEGPLPPQLTAYFNVRENEPAFGIIMRLEAGGNLDAMLHKAHEDISMTEKIRLLMMLCRGVEGLHGVGTLLLSLCIRERFYNPLSPSRPETFCRYLFLISLPPSL